MSEESNAMISVVVPIYNAEMWLAECIDSICGQSYSCLEILLIDDGSMDASRQICRSKAEQDKRIRVIEKENSGVSETRNLGVSLAKGKYLTFVDADEKIVEKAGMTIPEIFQKFGEEGFRQTESAVLKELGKESGLVIATGGGCVTREENYPSLHQNGSIIWIHRPIEALPTEGRPLSQVGKLQEMYETRKPMYTAFCDAQVDNTGSISQAVSQIVALLSKEDMQ